MGAGTNTDWKGEHFIRAKPTEEDRGLEGRRIISMTWHKKRRKAGAPTPAAAGHSRFTRSIFGDLAKGGV